MQDQATRDVKNTVKSSYPEIEEIGNDLDSLKSNVGDLASHVKKDGLEDASEFTKKEYENLIQFFQTIEEKIKSEPTKSIAIAFAGGIIASIILGRR